MGLNKFSKFVKMNEDVSYNLEKVKKSALDNGISQEKIDEIVDWFFSNGYTFDDDNFPTPLQKVIKDKFNLNGDKQPTVITTILMYEDMIRN